MPSSSKNFYITTTLPYVNADPHVGFAMEIVQADVVARYQRIVGREVFFSTGTDEHGQKIFEAAEEAGEEVKNYTNRYAAEFRKLKGLLNISNDTFIRTTNPTHYAAAAEMWRRCAKDIYSKEYEGLYCVGCESYKTERDLEKSKCVFHPSLDLQKISERNYFFAFKKYEGRLLEYLSTPGVIVPEWRRQEAVKFVKEGLEDFSVSREKKRLSWGVPVPNDDTQVMYVWFDALTSYISTLGWPDEKGNFKKFWVEGETVQLAGKDQVRFQSLMWQAMLMSAGVKNTDKVIYHGFINSGGQKMSKSLGNVINPYDVVKMFEPVAGDLASDVLRFVLLHDVPSFEDGDLTIKSIKESYNAHLANGLGNLVSRIMKMVESYVSGGRKFSGELKFVYPQPYSDNFVSFDLKKNVDFVFESIKKLDQKIQVDEPFKVYRENQKKASEMVVALVSRLEQIALLLSPLLPATSEEIVRLIKENKMPEKPLFARTA